MMLRKVFLLVLLSYVLSFSADAELIIESNLSFGKIAITDNSSVSTVQIARTGQTSSTNKIFILEAGTPGVYTLTDLPPFSVVNLVADVPSFSASLIPGTQQLTLRSVDMPASVSVDSVGTAQFAVGGVLETSGSGGTYIGPASYQITLNINFSF